MSAKFSPLLFLFFFFLILVSSCKKNLINNTQFDENNISNTKPKNGLSIDDAKNWYEQNSINTRALRDTGKSLINFKIHSPLWDKAINTGDSNYYIIEVPLQFDKSPGFIITNSTTVPQADKANDAVKLLILKDRNSGEMRSALMHVVSDDGIADNTNTYSKRNSHFTGFIFFTNLDGSFINGWRYEDGKITMSSRRKTTESKIRKRINVNGIFSVLSPPDPEPVSCSTYTVVYEERYCIGDSGDNCTPWMEYDRETYTYCTGGGGSTGDGGSGGIQYTTYYEPAPTVSSVQTISYNVQNPCITAVYNHITEQVLKSKLASMLQTFQTSTLININITSNNDLPANVYGEAYGDGDGTNYNIELNTDVLANCSQEFIAMIFYHEAIHVFLKDNQDTWNTTNSSEHLEMLSTYFDQITSAITEAYPSMPRKDAYAIILNCINNDNEDPSYNNAMVTATKEALISVIHTSYPDITDEADITAIASQYEEGGTKGTRSGGCHTLIP